MLLFLLVLIFRAIFMISQRLSMHAYDPQVNHQRQCFEKNLAIPSDAEATAQQPAAVQHHAPWRPRAEAEKPFPASSVRAGVSVVNCIAEFLSCIFLKFSGNVVIGAMVAHRYMREHNHMQEQWIARRAF
ncbi:hypothetical protein [Acidocella aquatica]|uniref:hypothetical protein n=1 Tax=Acidocella aquatica TaxID=1922313 RepID=UPI0024E05BFA|nr:hypothetical protein [Acidocella aquatica]